MRVTIIFTGILGALLLLAGLSFAQDRQIADQVIQRLSVQLNLSPKQVHEITPIILENIEKREKLLKSVKNLNTLKSRLKRSVQNETQEINKFLNHKQIDKLNYLTEQELKLHGQR